MELMNLLNTGGIPIALFGETFNVYLDWIGVIIKWVIGIGSVGVGIILFSLLLKVIVLPFDVYQRISMRKQNIKMRDNKEKMEKLQKQYANNKEMYNQKLMEMYKENGISMFSSCLPMILSMIIFIVAIGAFNAYAQYSNIENYNTMVDAYNAKMESYCAEIGENGENVTLSEDGTLIIVKDDDAEKYIYYTVAYAENYAENDYEYVKNVKAEDRKYYIDVAKVEANEGIMSAVNEAMSADTAIVKEDAIKNYFVSQAQDAVVVAYDETVIHNTEFLWIKNIWVTDAMYKHPVLEFSEFKMEVEREEFDVNGEKLDLSEIRAYTNIYTEDAYSTITAKLTAQKESANGYFVLIALSIGTILLQQFVSMRSQKEQQQFSTVDGQGASQQKMMMVVMTGMFAIFSFMYSSAFSIYMITSNLFSLLSTLVINKVVDVVQSKKEEKEFIARHSKGYSNKNVVKEKATEEKENNKKD